MKRENLRFFMIQLDKYIFSGTIQRYHMGMPFHFPFPPSITSLPFSTIWQFLLLTRVGQGGNFLHAPCHPTPPHTTTSIQFP